MYELVEKDAACTNKQLQENFICSPPALSRENK